MSQPQQSSAYGRDGYQPYSPSSGLRSSLIPSQASSPQHPVSVATQLGFTSAGALPLHTSSSRSSPLLPHRQVAAAAMAQPYNPQQWDQQRFGVQRVMPSSSGTRDVTGMEAAMPSPPPPYTPTSTPEGSSRVRPSPMLEQRSFTASPSTVEHPHTQSSAIASSSPAFPPPPNSHSTRNRERSASGIRLLSTIHTIAGRGKQPVVDTQPVQWQQPDVGRPPAARRAASTGHIGTSASSSAAPSRSESIDPSTSWQPRMNLPGPPPGPPPTGSRSQSMSRLNDVPIIAQPRSSNRPSRHAAQTPGLGPVPPTPADWINGDEAQAGSSEAQHAQQSYEPLRIDTGAPRESSLSRRPATRDTSAHGIRERRSRSKAVREGGGSEIDQPASPDRIQTTAQGAISQRREHNRKVSSFAESSHVSGHSRPSNVMTPPYTPGPSNRPLHSASSDKTRAIGDSSLLESFFADSLARHQRLIEREAAAANDDERLEIFAKYLVHESRLRRDRYHDAYGAMAGQIVDLTRDMWRSYSNTAKSVTTPRTGRSIEYPASESMSSGLPDELTPATEDGSLDGDGHERSRPWGNGFQPCLSPIPSMAVSTVPDEDSSRGRAPSRWWEQSQASGSIGKPERIEKSHRETKYMGITAAMLQSSPHPSPELVRQTPTPNASTFLLGPDEYPPEKVGFHENTDFDTPMPTPGRVHASSPNTPAAIDISRLITLPPPFPRHHPAVNNSHPKLADLRNEWRKLAISADLQKIRDAYLDQEFALKNSQQEAAKQRRLKMRRSMQEKLNEGSLTFAEAAQAEAAFDAEEIERGRKNARARFDQFEASVSHPLNTLVTETLALAEKCITKLSSDLEQYDKSVQPNRAQEEGDEHPERLEQLNLLKWLFEARETLHKDMFDLHAQRAEQYGEVVLAPYRLAKQQSKIDEAQAFFQKDSHDRLAVFNKDALNRHEEFLRVIEVNVTRGLEDQVSAFWDIAPSLRDLIQHVPNANMELDEADELHALAGFHVQIPLQEYDENLAYRRHPLQYLFSLLCHAEKSVYQFIESQVNLLCMLHAVRELTTEASLKALQLERRDDASTTPTAELSGEMLQARDAEGRRLTADLQDNVREVERQWREALGDRLNSAKSAVRTWLERTDGWEDGLAE